MMSLFEVDSLSFAYGRAPLIDGLKLTIGEGGVIALLGEQLAEVVVRSRELGIARDGLEILRAARVRRRRI